MTELEILANRLATAVLTDAPRMELVELAGQLALCLLNLKETGINIPSPEPHEPNKSYYPPVVAMYGIIPTTYNK